MWEKINLWRVWIVQTIKIVLKIKKRIYIEKKKEETLHTLQPSIIDIKPAVGSAWDTGSDDDPHWDTLLG